MVLAISMLRSCGKQVDVGLLKEEGRNRKMKCPPFSARIAPHYFKKGPNPSGYMACRKDGDSHGIAQNKAKTGSNMSEPTFDRLLWWKKYRIRE